jgi:cytoskeleton protein RodZ
MESVGQKLRAKRLELGFTLEEISAKTRISVRNLEALENDDASRYSSAFFYKSFVRQFARQLKIEFEELAAAVEKVTSTIPEPLMPGQDERNLPSPKMPALRPSHVKKLRWLNSFTSLILAIVACSIVYAIWQNSRPNLQATAPEPALHSIAFTGNGYEKHEAPPVTAVRVSLTQLIPNGE